MSQNIFRFIGLCLPILCCFILIGPSSSQAENLTVAYEEFPPYSSTNADGVAEGFTIDMIEQLAAQAGYQLEFVSATNPAGVLEMIEAGLADVSSLVALTPERLDRGLPTQETGSFELKAFALRERGFGSPNDLSGLRIGVVEGAFSKTGALLIPFSEIVEYSENDTLIVALLTGEIDAVVSSENSFLARMRNAQVANQVEPLEPALITAPHGFLVAKNRHDVQGNLNDAIETSLTPANLNALSERWFGRPERITDNPAFWIVIAVLAVSLVIIGSLGIRLFRYRTNASKLLKSNSANSLLIEALDKINGAIVIYDKDMRAIHRNAGFAKSFPSIASHVDAGMQMHHLIALSYRDGSVKSDIENDAIDDFVGKLVAEARDGTGQMRTVHAKNGLTYEARDFRLGENHFASIRVDITAQNAQQETIRQQAAQLENANEQLQAFSAIAAHDLKAPLRNIQFLADIIGEDLAEEGITIPDLVQGNLDLLQEQSERMNHLVEDLLQYAQAGTDNGHPQRFEPTRVISDALELVGNSDNFAIFVPEHMPELQADPAAFGAVMRNLISNAIKHHDKDVGVVRIHTSEHANFLNVHITDDGEGIPEQYRDTIFEPFKRLANTTPGSGLGLAFIKKTVKSWGGEVSVSTAEPHGSTFTVSVPMAEAPQLH